MKVNRIIDSDGEAVLMDCVLPLEVEVAINTERFGNQDNMADIAVLAASLSRP